MSLDAFSVMAVFLALIEVGLGVTAIVVALRGRGARAAAADDARRPLLALLVGTLITVAVVSLPALYLLRTSWVPRWPGIMCVEGVRRIGAGSLGAAGWLPALVTVLDLTKPVLIFIAGAWLVLRRASGPHTARLATISVVALGALAFADGAVQTAYVAIPKEEIAPTTGCCMSATVSANREAGLTAAGGASETSAWVNGGFLAAAAALGLCAAAIRAPRRTSLAGAALLAFAAAASVPLALSYYADVAAPKLLDQPFHHCIWCALVRAPETLAGAALYLSAVLAAGWSFVARLGFLPDAGESETGTARRLLATSSFGFLAAAAMSYAIGWIS